MQTQDAAAVSGSQVDRPHWSTRFPVHPAADLFPMMSDAELDELGKDIREHGMRQGIVLWTPAREFAGQKRGESELAYLSRTKQPVYLLDGRNRVAAVERENAKHPDREQTGDDDLLPFVEDLFALNGRYDANIDDLSPPATLLMGFVDPLAVVISANIHRRHLTLDKKAEIAGDILKARPELSNRQVADMVKLSHPKVAKIRKEGERSGDVETVSTRTDSKGRQQPAHKPQKSPAADNPAMQDSKASKLTVIDGGKGESEPPVKPAPTPPKPAHNPATEYNKGNVDYARKQAANLTASEWVEFWDWAVKENERRGEGAGQA